MDHTYEFEARRPCLIPHHHHHHHHHHNHHHHNHHHLLPHHHHHHHHQLFFSHQNQLHHHHHHHCHRHVCYGFASFPQTLEQAGSRAFQNDLNAEVSGYGAGEASDSVPQILEDYGLEGEEEDEPLLVLTDEWRDFFAKSEAKRKLEKKQAKKRKKKVMKDQC